MNKLLTMMAFVRVAESGSFTAAAAQLGVSVSAVAKAVTRLEEDLGVQLLVRTTRKLALNDDGREFQIGVEGPLGVGLLARGVEWLSPRAAWDGVYHLAEGASMRLRAAHA